MFALVAFLALPVAAFGQYQRNDRRRDRREDRQDRREDRREDRQERREARRGNDRDGYPNWGGSFELRQTALNAGYNEGTKEGRKDRQRRVNVSITVTRALTGRPRMITAPSLGERICINVTCALRSRTDITTATTATKSRV